MIDIFTNVAEEIFSLCPDLKSEQYKLDTTDPDGPCHCFYDISPEVLPKIAGEYEMRDSSTGEILDPEIVYQNYCEGMICLMKESRRLERQKRSPKT